MRDRRQTFEALRRRVAERRKGRGHGRIADLEQRLQDVVTAQLKFENKQDRKARNKGA
jgi:hypothetical protein